MIGLDPNSVQKDKPPLLKRRPGLIRGLYRGERDMWRDHYKRCFKIAARVLALGFVLGFAYFLLWPAQEKRALAFVMKSLKDIPLGAPPFVLAVTIFYHNVWASIVAVAAGIIPLACFPILDPLLNGAILGLLASLAKHQGLNVPLLFLKGVAPHGVFELTAVLYATSAGIYLSLTLWRQIRAGLAGAQAEAPPEQGAAPAPEGPAESPSPSREENGKGADDTREADTGDVSGDNGISGSSPAFFSFFLRSLASVARSFLLVVLPLLVIAAFIEAFITPHLH